MAADSNWKRLENKWPRYKLNKHDHLVADLSDCTFLGDGPYEVVLFTFPRYQRNARANSSPRFPVCVSLGQSWQTEFNEEEPSISVMRSLSNDKTGLPERAHFLAVAASHNGPELMSRITRSFADALIPYERDDTRWKWLLVNPEELVDSVGKSLSDPPLPPYEVPPRKEKGGAYLTISLPDDFKERMAYAIEFPDSYEFQMTRDPNYVFLDGRPEGSNVWYANIRRRIAKGEKLLDDSPQRVVLVEAPTGVATGLYYGLLGWTNPESGLFKKKASTQFWLTVTFDNGVTTDVSASWIDFVVDDDHESEILRVVAQGEFERLAEPSADPHISWQHSIITVDDFEVIGTGPFEVYAYTYESCLEDAQLTHSNTYPAKIGFTETYGGSVGRVLQQVSNACELAHLLMVGRCEDGLGTEAAIHRHLSGAGRKVKDAPGKEWYLTNAQEITSLFSEFQTI